MTAPAPDAALDDRWAIVGTSGAGKTYAALMPSYLTQKQSQGGA